MNDTRMGGTAPDRGLSDFLAALPDIRGKRIYIWGTGNTTELYQEGFARIPDFRIEAYIDNNPARQGTVFRGRPVLAPAEVQVADDMMILVCTGRPDAWASISRQIAGMGLPFCHCDAGIWGMFPEEIRRVYDLLEDEQSKAVYLHLLQTRADCQYPDEQYVTGGKYYGMPPFSMENSAEVFIDCGAFVGDSLEQYIWTHEGTFGKIIAFEPDTVSFAAMQCRAERLKREWNIPDSKFALYPFAVGEKATSQYVSRSETLNGLGSKISESGDADAVECRTVTLAPYLQNGCFVKADIESYEYRMLCGAAEAIAEYKPKIAVCIYHNAVDFYSLPLLLHQMNPAYRMRIRQHSHQIGETVLYVY